MMRVLVSAEYLTLDSTFSQDLSIISLRPHWFLQTFLFHLRSYPSQSCQWHSNWRCFLGQSVSQSCLQSFHLQWELSSFCLGAFSEVTKIIRYLMFVLIFLGKDVKLTNCSYVNITKTGMHFPQKTNSTLLHQIGFLYLQNRHKTSCSKNGARLLFTWLVKIARNLLM